MSIDRITQDAAAPIGRALASLHTQRHWRARDITFAYTYSGVTVYLDDRLGNDARAEASAAFMTALSDAGWGVSVRRNGLSLEHPASVTQL